MAPLFDAAGWYTKAANYPTGLYRSRRYYAGNQGRLFACLHISDGSDSRGWLSTDPRSDVSAHFLNRDDGVCQHVSINDSAWANGIWEPGHAYKGVPDNLNPNRFGISIENEGKPDKPLSSRQKQQLIELLRDLAQQYPQFRPYTEGVNLIRHTDISPSHRPKCPGPLFDLSSLAAAANGGAKRWRVRDHLSDDPADNFAAVRIEPTAGAQASTIGIDAVRLVPGFVVGVDAERGGWLHIGEPAPWGWVWNGLLTPVNSTTPIGPPNAPPAPDDVLFIGPPSITKERFARVLLVAKSPASAESGVLYDILVRYRINPAVGLAFFEHESSLGKKGKAVTTKNWGNIRRSQGGAFKVEGGFAFYETWAAGLEDWCKLIINDYVNPRKHNTPGVRNALRIYAPSSDNNNPDAYANAVIALVRQWEQGG